MQKKKRTDQTAGKSQGGSIPGTLREGEQGSQGRIFLVRERKNRVYKVTHFFTQRG